MSAVTVPAIRDYAQRRVIALAVRCEEDLALADDARRLGLGTLAEFHLGNAGHASASAFVFAELAA